MKPISNNKTILNLNQQLKEATTILWRTSKERERLEKINAVYKEALEFYSCPRIMIAPTIREAWLESSKNLNDDLGKTAFDALSKGIEIAKEK